MAGPVREVLRQVEGLLQREPGRTRAYEALHAALFERGRSPEDARALASPLGEVFLARGELRAAATCFLYAGDFHGVLSRAPAADTRGPDTGAPEKGAEPKRDGDGTMHAADRARAFTLHGQPDRAAEAWEEAGFPLEAALALSAAGHPGAEARWEKALGTEALRGDAYVHGLVQYQLALAKERRGDAQGAHRARVAAVHELEAAATVFEAAGERERAFDCYQVVLAMGQTGAFENLAEGHTNAIRILTEDGLWHHALAHYEDFEAAAMARGELRAAASVLLDAARFAKARGLAEAPDYLARAAAVLARVGDDAAASPAGTTLAENAYGAAIDAHVELGAYAEARALYEKLASLALPAPRRALYARLAARLATVGSRPRPWAAARRGAGAGGAADYPAVWIHDVREWERAGSAIEVLGDVMLDAEVPAVTRLQAFRARLRALIALHARANAKQDDAVRVPATAEALLVRDGLLSTVDVYPLLAVLERAFREGNAAGRVAVLREARLFFYKRTFRVVRAGLADTEAAVRQAAAETMSKLHFPHAIDPVRRIHMLSSDPGVRAFAVSCLERIGTREAAVYLRDAARSAAASERAAIEGSLRNLGRNPALAEVFTPRGATAP